MNWRTATVLELCRSMREAHDYSACPILADALQDADYPDADALDVLRSPNQPTYFLERLVAKLYSDEAAAVVERIEKLADAMGPPGYPTSFVDDGSPSGAMTHELLMTAATRYAETGDDGLGDGSMGWSNMGCDDADGGPDEVPVSDAESAHRVTVEEQFWKDWCLVTNRPMPDDTNAIFRCAC